MKKIIKIIGITLFTGLILFNVSTICINNSEQKINMEIIEAQAQPGVEFVQAYQCWKWITGGLGYARVCGFCGYMPFITGFVDGSCHY